ncbi:nitronate monooxygenase [Azospirillum sp. RWY-5-1]|uniref:Propionate 3-nitronate monooxygenase n=1 Tax=Azospirillum oleiclasticum TaxID=2735135 RepID=A0ABX2TAA7_9PROT|nr:nitronate monooxygenase family protein [Azospirillum oleiclasticum]NYZ12450.1 nitronate monooxygenase [Azospirillum oleiclasticum]NYZ19610.1 nitronate monooxygenase [Azospirillum oleiclasticum]
MAGWPDRRIPDLFGIEHPIIQAPMAGATTPEMVVAACDAGALGSLPCAMLAVEAADRAIAVIRERTRCPLNLNFFCHAPPEPDPVRLLAWRARLAPYYVEQGLDPEAPVPASARAPFDDAYCALVEKHRPEVVSFHFGLPEPGLLGRVKATGAKVISSATTVDEAMWLERQGCDAVIAMGLEAGGHRGTFLGGDMARQVGTFALVPQVADAVSVPVIAAGGIADARGIVAALALGASAVQIGTAYLLTPEAKISPLHRKALETATEADTALTNLFTGRPARGIMNRLMRELGPLSPDAPAFPLAGGALAPLRARTEPQGNADFQSLWSGQAARLARPMGTGALTRRLAEEALAKLGG